MKQRSLTKAGWKKWPDVIATDEFACQIAGRLEYRVADRLIAEPYCGPMFGATSARIDYLVTPNHRMWIKKSHLSEAEWQFMSAEDCHNCSYTQVQTGGILPFVDEKPALNHCFRVTVSSNTAARCTATVPGSLLYVRAQQLHVRVLVR